MASRQPLYIDSDNVVIVGPVSDRLGLLTATQIQNTTGTVTLYDADDNVVAGASNLAISIISGSGDRFYATIDDSISVTDGTNYYALATITSGGVQLRLRELLVGAYKS